MREAKRKEKEDKRKEQDGKRQEQKEEAKGKGASQKAKRARACETKPEWSRDGETGGAVHDLHDKPGCDKEGALDRDGEGDPREAGEAEK